MSFELSKTIRDLIDIELEPDFSSVPLDAQRVRSLSDADVSEMISAGDVHFIVRDLREMRHIPPDRTQEFWKSNVRGNVVAPGRLYVSASSFISGFYYSASEWQDSVDLPIILLEITR